MLGTKKKQTHKQFAQLETKTENLRKLIHVVLERSNSFGLLRTTLRVTLENAENWSLEEQSFSTVFLTNQQ